MAEYIDDDLLNEALQDGINAGMDRKALNDLAKQVIRGSIAQYNARANQDDRQQAAADAAIAKIRASQMGAEADRERLLAFAGGTDQSAASDMPITYGANPKTGVRAWNNLGWIADQPDQIAHLDPRQREVAQRYNADALSQVQGGPSSGVVSDNGSTEGVGPTRDPFRPPAAIIAQRQAQVIENQNQLRKMLDMSQLMTRMKIPAQIQDLFIYQMWPEAARRKLAEDIARLRANEEINGARKDRSLDLREDKEDRNAEYQREVVRLRRSAEHNSAVKAYEEVKTIYENAKREGKYTPEQLQAMSDRVGRMAYDIIMNAEAFMGNQPAPYGLPKPPAHDPLAGVTGAGATNGGSQYDDPDWWKKDPSYKAPPPKPQSLGERYRAHVQAQRDARAGKAPASAPAASAPAALPPPAATSSAPSVVKRPDGTYYQPGFENSPTKTKVDIPRAAREFHSGRDKVTKERIR